MQPTQQQAPQLNTDDLPRKVCECGYDGFEMEYMIFVIPELYRAFFQNQAHVASPLWRCRECGTRYEEKDLATAEPIGKVDLAGNFT